MPFIGFRICSPELRELGFTLPGLRRRREELSKLPALGLLTLAGTTPQDWTCSYCMTSASDSVKFNLTLLAIVSLWRVLLISRVVEVFFGIGKAKSFLLVMLFADTVPLVILYFTPLPIFYIMGGIRLSDSERIIRETATQVALLGIFDTMLKQLSPPATSTKPCKSCRKIRRTTFRRIGIRRLG